MTTRYARGQFIQGTTREAAWVGFVDAFKGLPLPGQPGVSVPEGAAVSAGDAYSHGRFQVAVERWDPLRAYSYSVKDSTGAQVLGFAVSLGDGNDGVFFEAELTRHGLFSGRSATRELRDRLGNTGKDATAYWGPWLRLPILRSSLVVAD